MLRSPRGTSRKVAAICESSLVAHRQAKGLTSNLRRAQGRISRCR